MHPTKNVDGPAKARFFIRKNKKFIKPNFLFRQYPNKLFMEYLINILAKYGLVLILILLLAGCSGVDISEQIFNPINKKENKVVLQKIQENINNFQIAKCKIRLSISTNINGDNNNYNARAVCLWQPNKKIRLRISHVLAGTISDILFDGDKWYITDEQNSLVYITKKIDTIRVAGFPAGFFTQIQRLPETWLPVNGDNIKIGKNDNSYQIKSQNSEEKFEWIFHLNSAFPSQLKVETDNNGSLFAAFSKPTTNLTYRSQMFKPVFEGYKVIQTSSL